MARNYRPIRLPVRTLCGGKVTPGHMPFPPRECMLSSTCCDQWPIRVATPAPTYTPGREERTMTTATRRAEEIRIGQLAIRYLVEGKDSAGSVAIFEFD